MKLPELMTDFAPIEELMHTGLAVDCLRTALDRKMFDVLEEQPRSYAEIGGIIGAAPAAAEALLRVLCALGVLTRSGETYANAAIASEYLVSGAPAFQGGYCEMLDGIYTPLQGALAQKMVDPKPEKRLEGDWGSQERLNAMGQSALRGPVQETTRFIAGLPGFATFTSLCDIGGSHGHYSMALLGANPGLAAVVADLPDVVALLHPRYEASEYAGRLSAVVCDLEQEDLPGTFDLILASNLLYGLEDGVGEAVGKIARGCKPGGWFVSNHYSSTPDGELNLITAVMELTTRLSGHHSHFLDEDTLRDALGAHGFGNIRTLRYMDGAHLLLAGRKGAA